MTETNASKAHLPIDIASALDRIGGDESFLYDLVRIYIEDFLEKFERLQESVESENFEVIKDIGHNLKGSSANLSLPYLQEISCKIENAGKEHNIDKARENLSLLEEEFHRLKNFVMNKT
ncbi:MAG: Hpt domain-containing protein [Candidatus Aminicenantales bacterium]